ncbi:ROK family protein [Solitalea sp. MAHUQ-68]|uniref:ROK family protein n=1 Tax=Solitalea agri TaxID=2953739 RepID=A0A9X2F191_9SPHI|nr:ROK family protein [Solitalea agri]MCO4292356.1 ROK family protein [Solitalea agri]
MKKKYAVGVDIGGSHITSAVIDLENGSIVQNSQSRMRVNAQGTPENIIAVWSECINTSIDLIGRENITGVGIAMPGPFDYDLGISYIKDQNKYDLLFGLNIKELLAKSLQLDLNQLLFLNDAACFLKGETFSGAAAGSTKAIGLTLGTGLGSAFYFDHKAEDANLWCSNFRDGMAEDYISTRWFVRRYAELSGRETPDVKHLSELVSTDGTAQMVFEEFGKSLSEFTIPLIKEKKPEYVVIGGNVANAWDLFINKLQDDAAKESPETKIVKAQLSEDAALFGAATLFL